MSIFTAGRLDHDLRRIPTVLDVVPPVPMQEGRCRHSQLLGRVGRVMRGLNLLDR